MGRTYIEVQQRGLVALVLLKRPEALNALNREFLHELRDLAGEIRGDEGVAGVVITGCGKSFCAGADISEMAPMNPLQAAEFGALGQRVMADIEGCGKPVVAAVNGYCIGGGLEIALACDFIIASPRASFAFPETVLGIIPGFGGTQRLSRLVGKGKAKELVFTGERIGAEEALRIGLANAVFPEESMLEESVALMQRICSRGALSLRLAKETIDSGYELDLAKACRLELDAFSLCFASGDQKEGMGAFLEKRAPVFRTGES